MSVKSKFHISLWKFNIAEDTLEKFSNWNISSDEHILENFILKHFQIGIITTVWKVNIEKCKIYEEINEIENYLKNTKRREAFRKSVK